MKVRSYGDVILGPGSKGAVAPVLEDDLRLKYDALRRENQSLLRENIELRARLNTIGNAQPRNVSTRSVAVQAGTSAECKLPKVDDGAQTVSAARQTRGIQTTQERPRPPPAVELPPPRLLPRERRDSETQCSVPYKRATASQTSRRECRTVGAQVSLDTRAWCKDVGCTADFGEEGEMHARKQLLLKIDDLLIEVNQAKEKQLNEAMGTSQLKQNLQWLETRWTRMQLVKDRFSEVSSNDASLGCGTMAEAHARASWLSKLLLMCERGDWDLVVDPNLEEHLRLTCTGQAKPPALNQAELAVFNAAIQGGAQSGHAAIAVSGHQSLLQYSSRSRGLHFNAIGVNQDSESSGTEASVPLAQRLRTKSSRTSRFTGLGSLRPNVGGAQ